MKKYQTDLQALEINLVLQGYNKKSSLLVNIENTLKSIESYIV